MENRKLILIIGVIMMSQLVFATTTYILYPIDDLYWDNSSYGTKGNKILKFNFTTVLQDYQDKNMEFVSARYYAYYYDIDKNWNGVELWTRNPANACWNETMTCEQFDDCKGDKALNRISTANLVKDDFKYYSWNASGTEGSLRPGTWWHLENNHNNMTLFLPFGANEYKCETIYNNADLFAEDSSGKDAIAWSKDGTHTPYLEIVLQDPNEERTKIHFRSTSRFIHLLSTMRHILLGVT